MTGLALQLCRSGHLDEVLSDSPRSCSTVFLRDCDDPGGRGGGGVVESLASQFEREQLPLVHHPVMRTNRRLSERLRSTW